MNRAYRLRRCSRRRRRRRAQLPAPPQPGTELWDRVVATVGDTALLYSDVLIVVEAMRRRGQTVPTEPAARDAFCSEMVQRRVDDLLLLEGRARPQAIRSTPGRGHRDGGPDHRVQQNFGTRPR